MEPVTCRPLEAGEITRGLFGRFERRQTVTNCWRKEDGRWVIRNHPFIDQWSETDYAELIVCLRHTLQTGGAVFGTFLGGVLKGFASVEGEPLGEKQNYLDLSSLHVSEDMRGKGLGRTLFNRAASWAKGRGAEKLYISSHSAVETQAFYKAMGCVEAEEYHPEHVRQEPFDCQLEYVLT